MPCLLAMVAFFTPRLVIVLLVIFSDYIGRAYHTALWPLLGFLFMPVTTLAYAYAKNSHGSVDGWYLALIVLAVVMDLGLLGGGSKVRRDRRVARSRKSLARGD